MKKNKWKFLKFFIQFRIILRIIQYDTIWQKNYFTIFHIDWNLYIYRKVCAAARYCFQLITSIII